MASWGDQRSSQGGSAWVFPPTKLGPEHVDMAQDGSISKIWSLCGACCNLGWPKTVQKVLQWLRAGPIFRHVWYCWAHFCQLDLE